MTRSRARHAWKITSSAVSFALLLACSNASKEAEETADAENQTSAAIGPQGAVAPRPAGATSTRAPLSRSVTTTAAAASATTEKDLPADAQTEAEDIVPDQAEDLVPEVLPPVNPPSTVEDPDETPQPTVETPAPDTSVPDAPTINSPSISPHSANSATLAISGSCTTGDVVHIGGGITAAQISYPNGQATQLCASSAYTFVLAPSSDATFDLQLWQVHPANGNASTHVFLTWIRDTLAPSVPLVLTPTANPFTSGDAAIALAGSCETGASVQLSGSSSSSRTCTASAFSFQIAGASDGVYNYTLKQTDAVGNASASSSFQWIRDTSVPLTPTITSPSVTPAYTNSSSAILSGSCVSNNMMTLSGDVTASQVTVPNGSLTTTCINSAFSYTINKSSDGTYNLAVIQTNAAGFDSAQATTTWIRDTLAPAKPTKSSPSTSPYTSSGQLSLNGSCELGATVILSGDASQSASCAAGSFSFTISEANDGTYTYALSQIDAAGNRSAEVAQVWDKSSTVPPTPTIAVPSANPFRSTGSSLTLTGTCLPGLTVALGGNVSAAEVGEPSGRLTQTCSSQGAYAFTISKAADGTYNLLLSQSDGLVTSGAAGQQWIRDTSAPTISLTATPPKSNLTLSAAFSFTVDDAQASVQCRLDSGSWESCASPHTYTLTSEDNAAHTFSIRANDTVGNISTVTSYAWQQEAYSTVALYHFNDNLNDSSNYTAPNSNPLTASSVEYGLGYITGTKALDLESSASASVAAAANSVQDTLGKTMTLEAWIKPETALSNGSMMNIMTKNGISGAYGWVFRMKRQGSSNRLVFGASLDSVTAPREVSSQGCTISTTAWTHVSVTWNMGTVKFFCDGVAKGTQTIGTVGRSIIAPSTAALKIGASDSSGVYFDGLLDEVRVSQAIRWNTSFTPRAPSSPYTAD